MIRRSRMPRAGAWLSRADRLMIKPFEMCLWQSFSESGENFCLYSFLILFLYLELFNFWLYLFI